MAKRLDVGPKAVIDHLEMLEKGRAGGMLSGAGPQKVLPHRSKDGAGGGGLAPFLRRSILSIRRCPQTGRGSDPGVARNSAEDMKRLRKELSDLEEKRQRDAPALEEIESREMEVKQLAVGAARGFAEDQLESEILVALLSGRGEVTRFGHAAGSAGEW